MCIDVTNYRSATSIYAWLVVVALVLAFELDEGATAVVIVGLEVPELVTVDEVETGLDVDEAAADEEAGLEVEEATAEDEEARELEEAATDEVAGRGTA